MKLYVVLLVAVVVAADRLENTYLPPSSAQAAGGNGNFLNAPLGPSGPAGHYRTPSASYGTPSAAATSNHAPSGGPDAGAGILKFDSENNGDGSYRFEYETENHIQHQEAGELRNAGSEQEAQSVHGSYSFTAPDGVTYTVTYIADEHGFRATGDHIPTPPPVPEAIRKSLEWNAAAEGAANLGHANGGYQNGYQNSNGYQNGNGKSGNNGNNGNNGSNGNSGNGGNFYHGASTSAGRQYIPPNKSAFNQRNGYQY